jgi:hypothetical protein
MIKKYNQFIKENIEDSITVPGFTKEELDKIKETAMRLLSPGFHEDYEVGAYLSSVANDDPKIEKLLVKWLKSQGANFYQPEYRDSISEKDKDNLLKWYMKGFNDELRGTTTIESDNKIDMVAYNLGAQHAIIGDDVSSIDNLSDEEIISMIEDMYNKNQK